MRFLCMSIEHSIQMGKSWACKPIKKILANRRKLRELDVCRVVWYV